MEVFPELGALDALHLVSALAAGIALWFVLSSCMRRFGAFGALLATAGLVGTWGLWFHGSLPELHTQQMLGCAIAAYCWPLGGGVVGRRGVRAAVWVLGATAAILLHRSNAVVLVGLTLGSVLSTFSRANATSWRDLAFILAGDLVAAAALFLTSAMSVAVDRGGAAGQALWLLTEFARLPSWSFVVDEIFGPLMLIAVGAVAGLPLLLRSRSSSLGVALLVAGVFFTIFGVSTSGGYFLGIAPLMAHSAASLLQWCEQRFSSRRVLTVVGPLVVLQAAVVAWLLPIDQAIEEAAWGDHRYRVVSATTEGPTVVLSADLSLQLVSGRSKAIAEQALWPQLYEASALGAAPEMFAESVAQQVESARASGLSLVLDLNWGEYLDRQPAIEPFMEALSTRLASVSGARLVEREGLRFLVLPPPAPAVD
ncbi:hypothetical protein [Engelhardtia mirabilis]